MSLRKRQVLSLLCLALLTHSGMAGQSTLPLERTEGTRSIVPIAQDNEDQTKRENFWDRLATMRVFEVKGSSISLVSWGSQRYVTRKPVREYLPKCGVTPLRVSTDSTFSRASLVDPDAFLLALAEEKRRKAEEALAKKLAEENARNATLVAQGGNARASEAPEVTAPRTDQPLLDRDPNRAAIGSNGSSATGLSASIQAGADGSPMRALPQENNNRDTFDPELLLRYFDNQETPKKELRVGVPFVLPYQQQEPLMMDSKASYQQTDDSSK